MSPTRRTTPDPEPCSTSPPGVAHSYSNVGTGPARMLFMYSPAGVEGMFAGIGKPGRRGAIPAPLDPADITAMAGLADKYGFTFLTG